MLAGCTHAYVTGITTAIFTVGHKGMDYQSFLNEILGVHLQNPKEPPLHFSERSPLTESSRMVGAF